MHGYHAKPCDETDPVCKSQWLENKYIRCMEKKESSQLQDDNKKDM